MNKGWIEVQFEELVDYIQPIEFIVKSTEYRDNYKIPVLTAGKSFIKGYTNEQEGIFKKLPAIIFDDFTTASRFVNFPFKVKSSAMKILVPSCDLINLKYVFYGMQITDVRSDTHKRYWISDFAKRNIPLPPLNEQNRITDTIEELFSELDNGVSNLKLAQNQLKVYRQALLKYAFEGKLTEQWHKEKHPEPAEKLLERIKEERQKRYEHELKDWKDAVKAWEKEGKKGRKPGKPRNPEFRDNISNITETILPISWKWENIGNVSDLTSGQHIMERDYNDKGNGIPYLTGPSDFGKRHPEISKWTTSPKAIAHRDEILITVKGSGVGKINLATITTAISRQLMSLKAYLEPLYIYYFFDSKRELFENISTGTAIPGIGREQILDFQIPVCSEEEQLQIIQNLELQFSMIDNLEKTIESGLQKSEALYQSILKKAFEGKLVPQDPKDEPASELLKRIQAEKKKYLEEQKQQQKRKPKNTLKMSKELSIEEALKTSDKPMLAIDVWQKSKHKDNIEGFYKELKDIQAKIKEVKKGTESLLSLVQ
ncbi:MAG: restriction endonuclease subunit S [Saprospiraceae bacterium]|nr:restriction endonuclease subunit S [Saprospiraceae bacterium]